MIKVSSICPLFFRDYASQIETAVEYIQKFAVDDPAIIVQSIDHPDVILSISIINLKTGVSTIIPAQSYIINPNNTLYEFTIHNLPEGLYLARIVKGDESLDSLPFSICSNEEYLKNTALISYTQENNHSGFGAIFNFDGVKRTFYVRIEGGFKSSGVKFNVENEQFRTQRQEIVELYAVPYVVQEFTIGNNTGVPVCVAELINNALCLSEFKINNILYRRSGESTPQLQVIREGFPQYNFTIELERSENIIYNGYMEYPDPSIPSVGVEIQAINPKDGEVLQYQKSKGAFINSSKI